MDIKDQLQKKSETLIKYAAELRQVVLQWEKPILITCSDLSEEWATLAIAQNSKLSENKGSPGVYYFKLHNEIDVNIIINELKQYKNRNARACPQIANGSIKDSWCLYCGSVKTNLYTRFKQHLGFGHEQTYSLQLYHWAKELKLDIEYHYSLLKPEERHLTELVEASLAEALKPLVGKIAK